MSIQGSPQAQPDRDAEAEEVRTEEIVAATDELFKRQAALPHDAEAANDPPTLPPLAEEEGVSDPEEATAAPSLEHDYVRELQQEFEEQEEEGKI
jgi:hypothetical protein